MAAPRAVTAPFPDFALRVLHVVPSLNSGTGGPAVSVSGLAAALSRSAAAATVASLDYVEHGAPVEAQGTSHLSVRPNALTRRLRGWSPALRGVIERAAQQADIVHSHALWMVPGIYARRAAERSERPLVISPRGMLDPWSLQRSRVTKRIAAWLFEDRNLEVARLFHATSNLEADSIRRYDLKQPIAVVPNGVDLPEAAQLPERGILERRFPELHGKRWLLFLGRLDPKKGLDLLLELWREMGARYPDWRLVVAGPDLGGFGARMVATVASDPALRGRTTFTGMLEGADKSAALAHSDLFVLPTRGENFGIAVAEALAHGTPVVTTTAAPWEDLVRHECGWWVPPEAGAIGTALETALCLPASEVRRMGENGRVLVRERLSWESIGAQWIEVYRWLLVGGTPPACVRLE